MGVFFCFFPINIKSAIDDLSATRAISSFSSAASSASSNNSDGKSFESLNDYRSRFDNPEEEDWFATLGDTNFIKLFEENSSSAAAATTNLDRKRGSAVTFSNWTDLDSEDDDFFLIGFDELLNGTFNGTANTTLHRNFSTLQGIFR